MELQQTAIALHDEWGMEMPQLISEATILKMLAERVITLVGRDSGQFFQLMYQLDISEKKLQGVMHNEDFADQIARLIYDRQLQKMVSRQQYKSQDTTTDPDLKW